MKRVLIAFVLSIAASIAAPVRAQAHPGQPAPAFSTTDVGGRPVDLAALRGRYVVLEWFNPSCPFVRKHYGSDNMQTLQRRYTADNVVWIAIDSTAAGHPEYIAPDRAAAWMREQRAAPTHVVLDSAGAIGRAYGARTTPQMVIIDPKGQVQFNGAIDSIRSADPADIPKATNYLAQAFSELRAGKPVSQPNPAPYGCSVKYAAG